MRNNTHAMVMEAATGRAGRLAVTLVLVAVMALAAVVAGIPGTALGASWAVMSSGTSEDLVDVWGTSSSNVYALAAGGALLHYNGGAWSRIDDGPLAGVAAEYGPHASSLWGSSATSLWVIGGTHGPEGGAHSVFRYSGSGWTTSTFGPGETYFQDLWGTSASNVVLVEADGLILRYNGSQWTDMNSGTGSFLASVWGSSASSFYAVGETGTILQYSGGTWNAVASGSSADLGGVWGSSSSDVFAVGSEWGSDSTSHGVILHRAGGAWGPMGIGATPALLGICGSSASNVFAVGDGGTILHFNGSSWSPWASGTTSKLNAIWGSASAGFFAVGDGGTILYYYDSPERPLNISPAEGAAGVPLTPTLQASAYADVDGDSHVASRWQVRRDGGSYSSPVWDSGSSAAATSITVPAGELAGLTRYYWRVGYQQAGGRWSSYSAETSFTTLADADVPPEVGGVAVESVGSTSANLKLSLTSLGSAASVQVSFEWGLTTVYGNSTALQAMTGTGSYSVSLYDLSPATEYHFRAVAVGDGTRRSADAMFITSERPPQVPVVASVAPTGVDADSATLKGELGNLGSAAGVEVSFEYGLTAAYGSATAPVMMNATGPFSAEITGLAAGTAYHFRAMAAGDGDASGSDLVFTTLAGPGLVVATGEASGVAGSTALLKGDLTSLGSAGNVTVCFVWGTSRGGPYPNQTEETAREATGSFESPLTGLSAGTTYYYQAKAAAGTVAAFGDEKSFVTTVAAPVIQGLVASSGRQGDSLAVTISGANLAGATAVGFGPGVVVTEFNVGSGGEITARITIGRGAEVGQRDVTVTTPGGTGTASGLFEVTAAGATVHLWVYLVAVAGGLAGLGLLASLIVWWRRRLAR